MHKTIVEIENKRVFVKTKIPKQRLNEIKTIEKDLKQESVKGALSHFCFFNGGFRDSKGKNIKKQRQILYKKAKEKIIYEKL